MIFSMTGFACASSDVGQGALSFELRSVNSRYLDLAFRIGDDLRAAEPALRELINSRVSRGKIEVRVNFQPGHGSAQSMAANDAVLARLIGWQEEVRRRLPDASPLTVAEVLRWPGMFDEQNADREALRVACLALASAALEDFVATRAREGAKLEAMIRERVAAMRLLAQGVEPRIPQIVAEYRDKLVTRLREAMAGTDDDRIRQEMSLYAARVDIAEELNRLGAHLSEVESVLGKGGVVGKRLDFIMQELNREANTLASKSMSADITTIAVELKLLIEQMREQIQNIE